MSSITDKTYIIPRCLILNIPDEVLLDILHYLLTEEVPVHLQMFLDLGREFSALVRREEIPFPRAWFLGKLHSSQRVHYYDWMIVNGVCQCFRRCGKPAFFHEKIFIIIPALLDFLVDFSCKLLNRAQRAMILSQTQHVLAYLKHGRYIHDNFDSVRHYNAFANLKVISIEPFYGSERGLSLRPLKMGKHMDMTPMPDGNATVVAPDTQGSLRHQASQDSRSLVKKTGLRTTGIQIELMYGTWHRNNNFVFGCLLREAYRHARIRKEDKCAGKVRRR